MGATAAVTAGLWILKNFSDSQLRDEIRKEREEAKLRKEREKDDPALKEAAKKKASVNKEFLEKFKKFIPIPWRIRLPLLRDEIDKAESVVFRFLLRWWHLANN